MLNSEEHVQNGLFVSSAISFTELAFIFVILFAHVTTMWLLIGFMNLSAVAWGHITTVIFYGLEIPCVCNIL